MNIKEEKITDLCVYRCRGPEAPKNKANLYNSNQKKKLTKQTQPNAKQYDVAKSLQYS